MNQSYRAIASQDVILHPLDSMTLIFQKSSGITHMVADPVPAILEVMAQDVLSADAIAVRLATNYDLEDSGDTTDIVLARLIELRALGLVEQV
jgi:PqqD family protein of HPr-rel-A system